MTRSPLVARTLALVLAILIAGVSLLLVVVPPAEAPLTGFSVNPGQYSKPGLQRHPFVYVPDEVITFTVSGNVAGEAFDAAVVVCNSPQPACIDGQILASYNDVVIPASLSRDLTYTVPPGLPDGDIYQIEVGNDEYLDTTPPRNFANRFAVQRFAIQAYEVRVEVDRPAYIGGDPVIVTWSANNLKDGSLAPAGYGQLWVYNTNGDSLISPSVFTYQDPSGSFTFVLSDLADPQYNAIVLTWFNDSASNPIRFQSDTTAFGVGSLGVLVDVTPSQYPPGGIVTANVLTVVTEDQFDPPSFNDPPEPNMNVAITVWEVTPSGLVEHAQYRASGLVTDAHGELTYVFQLDPTVADGTDFELRAQATHPNGIWQAEGRDAFTVSVAAGLSMVLQFNGNEFQAGDTVLATAIVSGAGTASLTYIFDVRDTTSAPCTTAFVIGGLLATSTQAENAFSYAIPENFDGEICFRVTADDGQGNRVTAVREFVVVFGWLLVNADRGEYSPGDVITVTWELKSNRITQPTYFYEVRDENGNLVTSGTAVSNFQFTVPDPASSTYTFVVTATQDGRAVSGSVTVFEVTGFFLTVRFDRSSYAPGDTVRMSYSIVPRGTDVTLPATFRISYGLLSAAPRVASTALAAGELTYVVPAGINEGDQIFFVQEGNTGASVLEVVTIRGTNPAWFVTAGDIPLLVLVMLLWLVVLTLLMWRRGALMPVGPRPEVPETPGKPEPLHAPATSPMSVTCRSCGSAIEITTSKRPIEVMCPKCGNTEMVA